MMLKLGDKTIGKLYVGDKPIYKAYWGDKLVYQAGKPIFLDYIEFDGASWIDTGLYGSNNTKIEATYQPTAFENGFYGSYSSGKNFTAYISKSGGWRFGDGVVYHIHTSSIVCDSMQNKDSATVNGKTLFYSAQSDFVTASTLTVGKVNGSTFANFKGNIYGFKIYESEELIQDLRPCLFNGVAGFYDVVTGKVFTNAGTGTLSYTE